MLFRSFPGDFFDGFGRVEVGQITEGLQLVILDVLTVLLREQVDIDPIPRSAGQYDAAVHVLVESLLEDSAPEIITLSPDDLRYCSAELSISNTKGGPF